MEKEIRFFVSGVGNRTLPKNSENSNWLGWIESILCDKRFRLTAAHDPDDDALQRLLDRGYLSKDRLYTDLNAMLTEAVPGDAILVANPAAHHAETIWKAVECNLHLLIEKPFVTDVADGEQLVEAIESKGLVSCVAQNWRYKDVGRTLHDAISQGLIGRVGHIFFRYVRDREKPYYPDYILKEPHPLLYAMGIHHLDLFRYLLHDEIMSISGHSFKPPWSLYSSDTGVNLYMETEGGIPIVYTGSISSQNSGIRQELLLIEGENGSLVNESEWLEPPLMYYKKSGGQPEDLTAHLRQRSISEQYDSADRYILDRFFKSIVDGEAEICPARSGLNSVCAVEAGRLACETGRKVFFSDVFPDS